MLVDLVELAWLESGGEVRDVVPCDAAALIADLGGAHRAVALDRGLYPEARGPRALAVEGDPAKVRRLLQNLLLNATKHTEAGGVTLSLGGETDSWWLMSCDTGPGLPAGPGATLAVGLKAATASARESDEKVATSRGKVSRVLVPPLGGPAARCGSPPQGAEGIGLSIVKRLGELLDASLEMASGPATGTTFRVALPRRYAGPPAPCVSQNRI